MRSEPSAFVRVNPARVEHQRGRPARNELGDAAQRVGIAQRALQLGVDDRVDVAGFAAAGVADRLLALGVGPAGAVGDHLGVAGGVAADRAQGVELLGGRGGQAGAQVVPKAEVAGACLGLARAGLSDALAVLLGGPAHVVVA
jgi:hypothetical protein